MKVAIGLPARHYPEFQLQIRRDCPKPWGLRRNPHESVDGCCTVEAFAITACFAILHVHHDADNGGQAYEQVVASVPDWAYDVRVWVSF